MAKRPTLRITYRYIQQGLRDTYDPATDTGRDPLWKQDQPKHVTPRANSPFKRAKRSPVIVKAKLA